MDNPAATTAGTPAVTTTATGTPAVTERLIFDVVKRTGLDFGVVSNVLFAARAFAVETATA